MLKLLFNRFSKIVLVMEGIGICAFVLGTIRCIVSSSSMLIPVLLMLVWSLYLFIRFCALFRWYPQAPRYAGIELQFKKALVPTSYILAIAGTWFFQSLSAAPLIFAFSLLLIIAHVNVILLYFHVRDTDPAPVNDYSSGRFLEHKASERPLQ